jgi:hypothetical protein
MFQQQTVLENKVNHDPEAQVFNITLYNNKYLGSQMTVGQVTGFFPPFK